MKTAMIYGAAACLACATVIAVAAGRKDPATTGAKEKTFSSILADTPLPPGLNLTPVEGVTTKPADSGKSGRQAWIDKEYTPEQQRAARTLADWAKSSGLEMRRESGKVYVNPALWNAMPLDKKEGTMIGLRAAAQMSDPPGTVIEIVDGYSGKPLMTWSAFSGPQPVN